MFFTVRIAKFMNCRILILLFQLYFTICLKSIDGDKTKISIDERFMSMKIIPALENYFALKYPPPNYDIPHSNHYYQNHHDKRCISIESAQSIDYYLQNKWLNELKGNPCLVATPCLGTDSLGNRLTAYFENLVCANKTGMHFISLSKVWEPTTRDKSSLFIDKLPSFIEHSNPADENFIKNNIKLICPCQGSCHERPKAVW